MSGGAGLFLGVPGCCGPPFRARSWGLPPGPGPSPAWPPSAGDLPPLSLSSSSPHSGPPDGSLNVLVFAKCSEQWLRNLSDPTQVTEKVMGAFVHEEPGLAVGAEQGFLQR